MEPSFEQHASVVSQSISIAHQKLLDTQLDVRAILFVARNRSGPPRIVACYPPRPEEHENDEGLNGQKDHGEEDDDDEAASSVGITSAIPSHRTSEDADPEAMSDSKDAFAELLTPPKKNSDHSSYASVELLTPHKKSSENSASSVQAALAHAAAKRTLRRDAKYKSRRHRPLKDDNLLFDTSKDSLAKLLTPTSRSVWHLRKLELRLNGRSFLGCPVFCNATQRPPYEPRDDADRSDPDASAHQETAMAVAHCSGEILPTKASQAIENPARNASSPDSLPTHVEPGDATEQHHASASTSAPVPIQSKDVSNNDATETSAEVSHSLQSTISSVSRGSENDRRNNPLAAFNVVAVSGCSPRKTAKQADIYHKHVGKPLALWLRSMQEKRDWVNRHIRKLEQAQANNTFGSALDTSALSIDTFGRDQHLAMSDIDRILEEIFNGLKSHSRIHLDLGKSYTALTLTIPYVLSTPVLPDDHARAARGHSGLAIRSSTLSTSGSKWYPSDTSNAGGLRDCTLEGKHHMDYRDIYDKLGVETNEPSAISRHTTIVLLHDREKLIAHLKPAASEQVPKLHGLDRGAFVAIRNGRLLQPLIYFLRNMSYRRTLAQLTEPPQTSIPTVKPEKSTPQSATAPAMPALTLRDAQALACILIRLGVARASLPLHASNTYIVSPTAPTNDITTHAAEWTLRFARGDNEIHVATLAELLHSLSEHEDLSQVSTSSVDSSKAANSISRLKPWATFIPRKDLKGRYMDMLAWLVARNWVVQIRTYAFVKVSPAVKRAVKYSQDEHLEDPVANTQNKAQRADDAFDTRPHRSLLSALVNASRPTSATGSAGSTRTAVRAAGSTTSRKSSHEQLMRPSSLAPAPEDKDLAPSLIMSPVNATELEQQWIDYIGAHLQDAEARQLWPVLVRYLDRDGQHALEEIAAMEGWKRASLAGVVKSLVAEDVVMTVRHW